MYGVFAVSIAYPRAFFELSTQRLYVSNDKTWVVWFIKGMILPSDVGILDTMEMELTPLFVELFPVIPLSKSKALHSNFVHPRCLRLSNQGCLKI